MITDALSVMPMSNPSSIIRCGDLCIEPESHFVTMNFMPEDAPDGEKDSKIAACGSRSTDCATGEILGSRHGRVEAMT
jgi:hypothetical protein